MPGRIVLYGATGYMGALTARAMVASGAHPVLAGRDQSRLSALAARLAQAGDGTELETAVAASEGSGPLRDLIGAGDVLVSTAGPFMKVGRPVVAAGFCGSCGRVRRGGTCQSGTGRGRPAPVSGCAGGPRTGPGTGSWPQRRSETTASWFSGASRWAPRWSGRTSMPLAPRKKGAPCPDRPEGRRPGSR